MTTAKARRRLSRVIERRRRGRQSLTRAELLAVDAEVDTADQVKQRCVDLGVLLATLGAAKDKTFVVILDACRDDPFMRRDVKCRS